MLSLPLRYAIKDLNGEELLAAGTLLDNQTLRALADRGRAQRYEAHCLLQNEVIRTDLPAFMKERPYGFILVAMRAFENISGAWGIFRSPARCWLTCWLPEKMISIPTAIH